jgi:acyl-CoA thioesterase YciA
MAPFYQRAGGGNLSRKRYDCAMSDLPDTSEHGGELVLRVMPLPRDVNAAGDVFGGWVMAQVDIAGAIPAMRRARGRIATVAVNSFLFKQPISVGDVVSFYAKIVRTGRTSITVDVQVFAERNPAQPVVVKVTEATLTYVCLHADGSKREVPPEA